MSIFPTILDNTFKKFSPQPYFDVNFPLSSQDVCGSHEKCFAIQRVNNGIQQYTLMLGDECIVAPLSLFYPELFAMTGSKTSVTQKRYSGDPEDPFDDHFIRETGVRF